jgi:hypothetical protein
MLHAVSCVDLKSLANSNYSMDIHGVIGAGWSTWRKYPCHSLQGTIKRFLAPEAHTSRLLCPRFSWLTIEEQSAIIHVEKNQNLAISGEVEAWLLLGRLVKRNGLG